MKSRVGDPPKSSPAYRHLLNRRLANGEFANATFYSFLVFPVLVYEIVVATKGRPVVIYRGIACSWNWIRSGAFMIQRLEQWPWIRHIVRE